MNTTVHLTRRAGYRPGFLSATLRSSLVHPLFDISEKSRIAVSGVDKKRTMVKNSYFDFAGGEEDSSHGTLPS